MVRGFVPGRATAAREVRRTWTTGDVALWQNLHAKSANGWRSPQAPASVRTQFNPLLARAMIKDMRDAVQPMSLSVILNWLEELKRLIPAN